MKRVLLISICLLFFNHNTELRAMHGAHWVVEHQKETSDMGGCCCSES